MWFIFSVQVFCCCSVSKSCLTLWSHGLRHTRLLCPAPADRVCSNSHSLSWWCHNHQHQFNHLILCHPLLLLPSVFPSIRVFSSELALPIRWSKYCSFSFSISPSNEYSGLVSFRNHWFDLLVVTGTLKSLLQHHSSKASVLWCSVWQLIMALFFNLTHLSTKC